MASSAPPTVTLALAPGRLGITIDVSAAGTCLVTGRPNLSSPLQVHDEILSLNGIVLADVQVPEGQVGGKVGTWVKLFAAFDGVERRVVVHRGGNGSGAAPASGASAAGHVHRAANAAKPEPQKMEVICLDDSDDDDAAPAAVAAKPAAGKKKPAFRDSNAGQKRKAPAKKPAAAKPAKAAKGAKKAPGNKRNTSNRKDEFVHDDNYMKLLSEGFNNYGSVSPCETYYIANNNDSYGLIADKIGLEDWKELNNVAFNTRFYGKLSARVQSERPRASSRSPGGLFCDACRVGA